MKHIHASYLLGNNAVVLINIARKIDTVIIQL